MGEVYRADDIKLGHQVALKFLPAPLAKAPAAMARLRQEVRVAREVAHPNICRVYDLTETEAYSFITMEYVDGEDLASVLRRLGPPARKKALQIARQLCAGLSAAHERGVLHLDLKPANLMIDGHGQVRVMDFGISAFAHEIHLQKEIIGTPAYMAPEQLAGRELSTRSDLYSLGLVLYELFTGQRAFQAGSIGEWKQAHERREPIPPSRLAPDLEPAVENAILGCLEKNPEQRPRSAMAVAAMLPGGDPLAEMLAAGDTPSPEMVASAGGVGGLRPRVALACLGSVLIGLVLVAMMNNHVALFRLAGPEKPALVLADRARGILKELGYSAAPIDRRYGLAGYWPYLQYVAENDKTPDRWKRLREQRPRPYIFWYRESPTTLIAWDWSGRVSGRNPPLGVTGMSLLALDDRGHLEMLHIVPPQLDESSPTNQTTDYSWLFEAAGLEQDSFVKTNSVWNPDVYADQKTAWLGQYPGQSNWPVRVEAASYRGRPVYFRVLDPPDKPQRHSETSQDPLWKQRLAGVRSLLTVAAFIGVALVARRNLRLGRGDRKGAMRFGFGLFLLGMSWWLLGMDHVKELSGEVDLILVGFVRAVFLGVWSGLAYLALEPYTRRLWPTTLISWTRLIQGQVRNPRVGRDILIGAAAGVGMVVIQRFEPLAARWLGSVQGIPYDITQDTLIGGRKALSLLIEPDFIFFPFSCLLLLTSVRFIVRKQWLAVLATLLFMFVMDSHWMQGAGFDTIRVCAIAETLLVWGILLFILVRFGILSSIIAYMFVMRVQSWPVTLDMSSWYAVTALPLLAFVMAIAYYGFRISMRRGLGVGG